MSENSTSSTDHSKQKSTGKRKYHQKSRLGCSTCKKRRVKCDETRPTCKKCQHMDLVCGYTLEDQTPPKDGSLPFANKKSEPMAKKRRVKEEDGLSDSIGNSRSSSVSSSDSQTQQATPAITPSPSYTDQQSQSQQDPQPPQPQKAKPFYHNLLNAGNLNNLNLSHLVNNLSGLGDLSNLGSLTSLGNLATLAQLPIDLSSLGGNSPQLTPQPQQQPQSQSQQQQQQQPQQSQQASVQAQVAAAAMNSNPLMNLGNLFAAGSNDFSQFMKSQGSSTNTTQARPQRQHQQQQQNQQAQQQDQQAQQQQQQQQQNQQQNQQQPQAQAKTHAQGQDTQPSISPNVNTSNPPPLGNSPLNHPMAGIPNGSSLNMLDLRLMFHYTSQVSNTITGAGISDTNIWNHDIPMLAFNYPFLMHSILAFSATHLSRTEKGLDQCVTCHRGDALRLLREAVLDINNDNTDALVASALILIMDSLANASFPSSTSPKSLPASAWIFHVKGAATILTAVWPLTEQSRFYKFISVDLGDLGDIPNQQRESKDKSNPNDIKYFTDLECHDSDIADLFPVEIESPYLITLAYLNKLHKERYKSDFILRIFAFPALLDKNFLSLLMTGDIKAMRIMRSYYKLLRSFTTEMKDKVWFLEGVSQVLPVDVEEYAGGAGGMHMMLDFLGGGPSIIDDHEIDEEIGNFDPSGVLTNKLIDTNNLPSDITSNLDVMQGDSGFMNIK